MHPSAETVVETNTESRIETCDSESGLSAVRAPPLQLSSRHCEGPPAAQPSHRPEIGPQILDYDATHEPIINLPDDQDLSNNDELWRMYNMKAAECDQAMASQMDKTLDVHLIFAGLFSAVLTTFIGYANNNLSDPTESLLRELVALQQVSQLGLAPTPGNLSAHPASTSTGSGTLAVCVNGLWTASLVLTLGSVVIIISCKQWFVAYGKGLPIYPADRALTRQLRYDGWQRWKVDEIQIYAPLTMQLALWLFLVGLILWMIDTQELIAIMLGILTALITLIYLGFSALPLFFVDCPYHSPLADVVYFLYLSSTFIIGQMLHQMIHSRRGIIKNRESTAIEPGNTNLASQARAITKSDDIESGGKFEAHSEGHRQISQRSHAPSLREKERDLLHKTYHQLQLNAVLWLSESQDNDAFSIAMSATSKLTRVVQPDDLQHRYINRVLTMFDAAYLRVIMTESNTPPLENQTALTNCGRMVLNLGLAIKSATQIKLESLAHLGQRYNNPHLQVVGVMSIIITTRKFPSNMTNILDTADLSTAAFLDLWKAVRKHIPISDICNWPMAQRVSAAAGWIITARELQNSNETENQRSEQFKEWRNFLVEIMVLDTPSIESIPSDESTCWLRIALYLGLVISRSGNLEVVGQNTEHILKIAGVSYSDERTDVILAPIDFVKRLKFPSDLHYLACLLQVYKPSDAYDFVVGTTEIRAILGPIVDKLLIEQGQLDAESGDADALWRVARAVYKERLPSEEWSENPDEVIQKLVPLLSADIPSQLKIWIQRDLLCSVLTRSTFFASTMNKGQHELYRLLVDHLVPKLYSIFTLGPQWSLFAWWFTDVPRSLLEIQRRSPTNPIWRNLVVEQEKIMITSLMGEGPTPAEIEECRRTLAEARALVDKYQSDTMLSESKPSVVVQTRRTALPEVTVEASPKTHIRRRKRRLRD